MKVTMLARTSTSPSPWPGLGVGGLEEEREDIARRRPAALDEGTAAVDQLADGLLEEADRRPRPPAAEARDPIRQAEHVEGIDRAERLEIAGDRAPERVRIAREPLP